MIDPAVFLALLQDLGVTFFAGVPDSLLLPFIGHLLKTVPSHRHVIAAINQSIDNPTSFC
jgi:hypothetical protein